MSLRPSQYPLTGLTPENVVRAVEYVNPVAVDVSSGVEQNPQKKDIKKMKDFISIVKSL